MSCRRWSLLCFSRSNGVTSRYKCWLSWRTVAAMAAMAFVGVVGPNEARAAPSDNTVARHGLTPGQYQLEFDKWVSQGYRLTDVDGYSLRGAERYAAIWERMSG